ncbi:hypothetical protein BDR07DRAFT_1613333 [Suillus spraguei]|nr:hypothetical protein BDR07DRAFT_1613333 [Suillus spraguei]
MSELIPITTPMREFEGHESWVMAVAVFPDKRRMVTASGESLRLWDLQTGVMVRKMEHHNWVLSLAVSRDGKLIASGDHDGEVIVWDGETGESLTQPIKAHSTYIFSLNFSPDGTALASGSRDKTTKLWNARTWEQQGDPVECDSDVYNSGTRERVPFFNNDVSLAWTPDGTRLLTGGIGDPWTGHSKSIFAIVVNPAGTLVASASNDHHVRLWQLSDRRTIATFKHPSGTGCVTFSVDGKHILSGSGNYIISEWAVPHPKILAITTARFACISGELSIAEELLTQYINTNSNSHISYSHRSLVMARKHDWDRALQDAIKSINIKPSLTGYMSKGIAFCGKGYITDARAVFDVASMYTDQNSQTTHFLLLIKAIALFGADQHDEASLLLKELTTGCPNADTRACHIVQAYLHVQLGIKASHGARYDEAAEHFTAAINCSTLSSKLDMHHIYEDLVVLFGWDLESLWLTAHQKRCDALLCAGRLQDAMKSYRCMMDASDDITEANCLEWSNAFTEKCSARCLTKGDAALAARNYESAIELYSAVIDLGCTSDVAFVNRSEANLGKMLWEDALLDAQKVIELDPSSRVGYQLTHAALRGAQRYDEAIDAFTIMLSKLDGASETQIRDLRQQYIHPSQAEDAIQRAVWIELDNAPLRLLNTSTGLYLRTERIKEVVVMYFRCVLLSHRWEEMEALLQDIQDKVVYELNGLGGIAKLQSFCKVARDTGYRWAWMDTCCIDKRSNTEVQESVNSMFIWYRHSALTIVYLCDVPPSSRPGALARSFWNHRGWTFQEFVAPKVVLFYQKDWSLYLGDSSPNHKESPAIMKELEDATGIDARALVAFRPGMSGAREKLQWASKRITTVQEDIAYSLCGIFGIALPVIYGEKKQNALGRLLQEIVARSGDITVLDWIGQPSEFNSCLPAHIVSYTTPRTLPSLSEDDIHTQVSSLRQTVPTDVALKFYDQLLQLRAPRFANCRLHLPCISFHVTDVGPSRGLAQDTSHVQGPFDGRPWDRNLLGVPDFVEQPDITNDTESMGALRLMVRLRQPFNAFLLARQHIGEYKRIASDYDIIAQVKDITSIDNMDVMHDP